MEASTAIGFQTVLTVSELGLSHAHWPVSMVTSLMGIRGCVRKCSPSHSRLWGEKKLYGVWLSGGCSDHRRWVSGVCLRLPGIASVPFVESHNKQITRALQNGWLGKQWTTRWKIQDWNHVGACHQNDSTQKALMRSSLHPTSENVVCWATSSGPNHLVLYIAAKLQMLPVCLDVTHIRVKIWVSVRRCAPQVDTHLCMFAKCHILTDSISKRKQRQPQPLD